MGCFGSSSRNLQFPTYYAILQEIFDLIPREEALRQFNKKSEIMKYLSEFEWNKITAQFRQVVKTLTDHIESCKIRLNDSALFVENKIKLTQNPIVIKMCMLILLEFVQNLHKFTQSKEIPVLNQTHDESKLEMSQRSIQLEQLHTLTQVSDNFLKFELAFSNILSILINEKMVYALVWWEYLLQTLELYSKKTTKQFQSENISCILTFLEYVIGTKLGYQDQFEWMTKNQEDQLTVQDLLDSIKDPYGIVVVYKDIFTLIPPERLFVTKSQKSLLNILLKDRKKFKEQPAWSKLIETFLQRALNQQLYEELFQMIFCNFDEEQWINPQDIIQITYVVLEVAKDINQLSNTELFIFSKLIDYLDLPIDKTIFDSPSGPPLMKKGSEFRLQQQGNPNVKNSILKLLCDLFHNIDSNQFILFQQSQTIKALLNNLKSNHETETFNDTKLCLIALLKQISLDSNSVQLFVYQIINFTYHYHQNLINNQAINAEFLNSLLIILHQCVNKIDQYHQNLQITEEVILMLIEIAEFNNKIQYQCAEILITIFIQASKVYSNENNEVTSFSVPNQNIAGLSAFFLSNAALVSLNAANQDASLINQFFDFIPGRLSNQQIISILAYLIDENSIKSGNKQTKSSRKYIFDQYKDKELRFCMIIKLISFLDEEIAKNFSTILYSILGPQFQLYKKKGFSAYQDISTLLSTTNINTEMQQILSLCLSLNPIDFEKIKKQFKENLSNQNHQNGIINLDDIQVKEDLERGSILNQSFQAPSHIEVQLDESFEKQLQTIKKQKMKQEKLEHLTTEQREMKEF